MTPVARRAIDNCAVCLYFDADAAAAVRLAWKRIAEAGISDEMPEAGWRPHVTLSGCRDLRLEEYLPVLREFAAQTKPQDISFTSVGYFGGGNRQTVFLAPTVTRGLLNLHERHHGLVAPFCSAVSPYYTPDGWTPHCTLALNLPTERLAQAVTLTDDFGLPIMGRLMAVGVVRVARPQVEELSLLALD